MKYLEFLPPEKVGGPYPQPVILYDQAGGKVLGHAVGATAPNPHVPGQPDVPNLTEYPIVRPGTWLTTYRATGHHDRPCLSFNGYDGKEDGEVWIIQDQNPRHPGQGPVAIAIRVHEGYSASWRGSAGCMTLASPGGDEFLLEHFEEGEQVAVFIPDQDWFSKG